MNVMLLNPGPEYLGKAPPLGLAYIGSMLETHGVKVRIVDVATGERLEIADFGIIGIHCHSSAHFPSVLKIATNVKRMIPDVQVVIGGIFPTFYYRQILKYNCIDIVVLGEGEHAMLELASAGERSLLRNVNGIAYREEGKSFVTQARLPISDLDSLPLPARHLLPMNEYGIQKGNLTSSRGCPWSCIFCSASAFYGRRFRCHSPTRVVDEMEHLMKQYSPDLLTFVDDLFTYNKDRVSMISDLIRERGLNVKWVCNSRVDTVDEQLLKKMNDSGCIGIFFGIESASQQIINTSKKRFKIDQAKKAIRWAKQSGIEVTASFTIGLPGETQKSINQTLNFIKETRPDNVSVGILVPYLGTEVHKRMKEFGISIVDNDLTKQLQGGIPVIRTSCFTPRELFKLYVQIIKSATKWKKIP